MVISWATGRFPRGEFDTMLVSMSPRAPLNQRCPKTIKFISFEGSVAILQGSRIYYILIGPPIIAFRGVHEPKKSPCIHIAMYRCTSSYTWSRPQPSRASHPLSNVYWCFPAFSRHSSDLCSLRWVCGIPVIHCNYLQLRFSIPIEITGSFAF